MFEEVDLTKILFIDIETVSSTKTLKEINPGLQSLWFKKCNVLTKVPIDEREDELYQQLYEERAAIYAEFGKIVCVSLGFLYNGNDGDIKMRVKSIANEDEFTLLKDLATFFTNYFNDPSRHFICGHNIKEFDVPYICRRMLIKGVKLPKIIDVSGKKPWELKYLIDTLELWKFGDYKHYTSLSLLTNIFEIPTPKDDIDGSQVGKVFWYENNLARIVTYCEKDVLAVANLFLKLNAQKIIDIDEVEFVD